MDDAAPPIGQVTPEWLDFLAVAGAILVVVLLVVLWVLLIRKQGTRRRKRRHHHRTSIREAFPKTEDDTRSRRRRRRREHRPINPTLAQTGGLLAGHCVIDAGVEVTVLLVLRREVR